MSASLLTTTEFAGHRRRGSKLAVFADQTRRICTATRHKTHTFQPPSRLCSSHSHGDASRERGHASPSPLSHTHFSSVGFCASHRPAILYIEDSACVNSRNCHEDDRQVYATFHFVVLRFQTFDFLDACCVHAAISGYGFDCQSLAQNHG